LDNTEKSRRRRARAKAEGAERINVELRGARAERWRELVETHGGPTQALGHLIDQSEGKRELSDDALLSVLSARLKRRRKS